MRVELLLLVPLPDAAAVVSVVVSAQPWSWNTAPNTAASARRVFVNCIARRYSGERETASSRSSHQIELRRWIINA